MECAICLDPLSNNEKKMEMPACQHVFHTQCFLDYMKRGAHSGSMVTCPECRHVVIELPTLLASTPAYVVPTTTHVIHPGRVIQSSDFNAPLPENVHRFVTGCAAFIFIVWMIFLSTRLLTE